MLMLFNNVGIGLQMEGYDDMQIMGRLAAAKSERVPV